MDLNDYDWDAYLANDRTLSDPDVIRVERNGRVRLRVVNASAATVFWIDTGRVEARLVAVDGQAIQPLTGSRFGVAMAQRLDLELGPRRRGRLADPCAARRRAGEDRPHSCRVGGGCAPAVPVGR